jgi:hypothetical protein
MPNRQTVLNWQDTNPDFSAKYARARELQADYMDEEILEVTRRTIAGTLDPNVARVALLGLQWRAGRLNAKRYGERQQVDLNSKLTLEQIVAATMVPRAPKSTDT